MRLTRLAAVWILAALSPTAAAQDRPALRDALALEAALQEAIRQAEPSVVCILVSRSTDYKQLYDDAPPPDRPGELGTFEPKPLPQRTPFPSRETDGYERSMRMDLANANHIPESFGSGVVVDPTGLVLTNYHVVRGATKVYVRLPGGKGSYANIHAADPRSDLAVLRLLGPNLGALPAIKVGDGAAVRKGQFVVALSNPFAAGFRDGSPSASWGIVSNVRRRAPSTYGDRFQAKTLHQFGTLIQTDARLNLGCSGGALLNLKGEVVGLTTALAALSGSETAGGFAVPFDAALRRVVDKLKAGEEVEYGLLGVTPKPQGSVPGGVAIHAVSPGSPADEAQLRVDDVILAVNGTPIDVQDDLFLHVGKYLAGSRVVLDVRSTRDVVRKVPVTLHKYYVPGPVIASNRPEPVRGLRVEYVGVLQQILQQNPGRTGFGHSAGVYITSVESDSPAARSKLQPNRDVITHVAEQPVRTPQEFYQAVRHLERTHGKAAPIELTVVSPDWHKGSEKITLQ
jgi:serine protease Do